MENWKLIFKRAAAFAGLSLITACNGIESNLNFDLNHATGSTAVVLGANFSDPTGSIATVGINDPRTATLNVQTTGPDAKIFSFFDKLYVVNRLGRDNIQIIDPKANFATTLECSLGQGTNPQQIIVVSENKAYVTLLQPANNRSAGVDAADVMIVNPKAADCDHFIQGHIDLTPYTADDGERLAHASAMVFVDSKIYVALQDSTGAFAVNQSGKVVVIDTDTETVLRSVTLSGRNPVTMTYSAETGLIYIVETEYIDRSNAFGGIEALNPETDTSLGIIVDDQALGGDLGEMEVTNTLGLVVVSSFDGINYVSHVRSFPLVSEGAPAISDVYASHGFIQDIAVDENGTLLVGDGDPEVSGIVFINPENGHVINEPISTGPAPSSITFINL